MHQQVMSPTRAGQYSTTGRGNVNNPTPPLVQAGSSGVGFGLEAAGRASVGINPSGTAEPGAGVQQVSTTSVGDGVVGGIRFTGEGEGFVTPRSQQGLPTISEISEMVEGFPGAGIQLMTRAGKLFLESQELLLR